MTDGPLEEVIDGLARGLRPVRRLRPPLLRATLWLAGAGAFGAVTVAMFADLGVFRQRAHQPHLLIELAGTAATGVLAVIAAFHLSLPDRSPRWALLPLPALAIWLGGSGMGCYSSWVAHPDGAWTLGESAHCLVFILGVGLPLTASLLWLLWRARPLAPVSVAATAALGAAALSAALLQFFHPFEVTFMDLAVHATAVATVILTASAWSRRHG